MDIIYFILAWFAVIFLVNAVSWIFFPETMKEITKLQFEWIDYKLKKYKNGNK